MRNCHFQVVIEDRSGNPVNAVWTIPTQCNSEEIPKIYGLTLRWAEDAPSSPQQYRELLDDMRTVKTEYIAVCNVLKTAPEPLLSGTQRAIARMQRQSARRLVTNMYTLCYEHNLWAKENYESRLLARHNTNDNTLEQSELDIITNTIKNRNHAHAKATNRSSRPR